MSELNDGLVEPENKTNNEKVAELMLEASGMKLGDINCYKCAFCGKFSDEDKKFRVTCNSPMASVIKSMVKIGAMPLPALPMIAVIDLADAKDDVQVIGADDTIPAVLASEFGLSNGLYMWPTIFDPAYTLWCIMYEEGEPQTTVEKTGDIQENSTIDKSSIVQ